MSLISCHGLTVDPVEKVLRLSNEEFILNQRSIEYKPVRLIACQNVKARGNAETIVPVRAEVKPGFSLSIIPPPHTPKKTSFGKTRGIRRTGTKNVGQRQTTGN
ncbi:hypothetical protein Zmor_015320 [Zophobas morio]|uniref:Uncharacterized protein n=1 Tax=Zophobas morio TaxID=2755281 RepID=A0AA38MH37_9CUCU|nr:hypothetical protein Zmor_015320 [Zophobas morio]